MKTWIGAIFFVLLAVPFHSFWQDWEVARRGILVLLVGVLFGELALRPRTLPHHVSPGALALLAWLAFSGASLIWSTNRGAGWQELGYFTALWLLLLVASGPAVEPRTILRAILPAGIATGTLALLQEGGLLLLPDSKSAVSTLGNLNVASEFLTMSGVAAAALVLREERANGAWFRLAVVCLAVSGIAVGLNDSLSGRIALPVSCALLGLFSLNGPRRGLGFTLITLLGILPAALSFFSAPETGPTVPAPAANQTPAYSPSTSKVRLELWRGTWHMAQDAPVVGHGVGQFPAAYPKFRTREELEETTFGRRFHTTAESAHNDYLEAIAEGGFLGGALLAAAAAILLFKVPLWSLAILFAFAFHAGVRAPIGNAPVAAFVFLFLGSLQRDKGPLVLQFRGLRATQAILGILLAWVGLCVVASQFAITGYVKERREDPTKDASVRAARTRHQTESLESALWWNPHDARLLTAQADSLLQLASKDQSKLAEARAVVVRANELWPHEVYNQIRRARLLQLQGSMVACLQTLDEILAVDPGNPEATVMATVIWTEQEQATEAIKRLYSNLHPRVRENLLKTVAQLHALAQQKGHAGDAVFLYLQSLFVQTVDYLDQDVTTVPLEQFNRYATEYKKMFPDLFAKDMRCWVLWALYYLALDKPLDASGLAPRGKGKNLKWIYRAVIGEDRLAELVRRCPEWKDVLTK